MLRTSIVQWRVLKICTFRTVAVGAQELEVIGGGRAAEGNRDDVVILEVEGAAALCALAPVPLEHCPPELDAAQNAKTHAM
jgi:hypothetical protein